MKVSVIVPTHNREKYIGRAIRSLLDQVWSKQNYEIIVVNDGSSDQTEAILNVFSDSIKVINLPKNTGLPYACNAGIKQALGKFIVRVDDDDYLHEDFLKILYSFIEFNKDFDAVCCDYLLVDEEERVIERRNSEDHPIACGIMFKKDNLVDIGLYDENFLYNEEKDLRARYLKKYNIHRIELPLYRYMMHSGNMTRHKDKMAFFKKALSEKHK
ncbi:MAG: glycosyltransferase family A protein [Candidatus Staskawiczbacteria bacterium]|nr:glycosyltransferase family A protein [Candidatus Staskawiczbacteria bacterium]